MRAARISENFPQGLLKNKNKKKTSSFQHDALWTLVFCNCPFQCSYLQTATAWVLGRNKFKDVKNSLRLKGPLRLTFGSAEAENSCRTHHWTLFPPWSPRSLPFPLSHSRTCGTPGLVSFLSWMITSTLLLWTATCGAGTASGTAGKGPIPSPSVFCKRIRLHYNKV